MARRFYNGYPARPAASRIRGAASSAAQRFKQTLPKMIRSPNDPSSATQSNVLGGELLSCGLQPVTGFFRDGCCRTGPGDVGLHVVCAVVTEEFLSFSLARGNDLVTPMPHYGFPGLRPGDRWCLCAARWKEALEADVAPPVILEATHFSALAYVSLDDLRRHAVSPGGDGA